MLSKNGYTNNKSLIRIPIEIYVDNYPKLSSSNSPDKDVVIFLKYGAIPAFMTGSGIPLGAEYHIRLSNGIYVTAGYPIHHDLLVIGFHNMHWDAPAFYSVSFNLS